MSDKAVMMIVGVLAGIISAAVCWFWYIDFLTSKYGLHGGWGFEIFIAAFAALYVPIALVRRSRQRRRQAKKSDDGGAPQ